MKKRILTYLILGIAPILSVTSCERHEADEPAPVDTGFGGYIFFDTEVATRGELVTSMREKSFGVLGYKYSSDWNTYKATAVPNVFQTQPLPQQVTWNGSSHTYQNLKQWENGMKYTFFGYYPWGLTTASTAGIQNISYTMPSWTNPANLQDVMTGMISDIDNSGNGVVGLTFKHRLACLNIEARNLNDEDESIYNLQVKITSNMYNTATIPMDPSQPIVPGAQKTGNKTFQVIANSQASKVTVPESDGSGTTTDLSGTNNIIFIPQTQAQCGNLTGSISFIDKQGRTRPSNSIPNDNVNCQFSSSKDFEAGKKYTLIINFSDEAISIAIIESGDWTDKDQDIIFE